MYHSGSSVENGRTRKEAGTPGRTPVLKLGIQAPGRTSANSQRCLRIFFKFLIFKF